LPFGIWLHCQLTTFLCSFYFKLQADSTVELATGSQCCKCFGAELDRSTDYVKQTI